MHDRADMLRVSHTSSLGDKQSHGPLDSPEQNSLVNKTLTRGCVGGEVVSKRSLFFLVFGSDILKF